MTLSPIGLRCGIALYIVDLSYLHRSITVNLMMFLLTIYQTYSKDYYYYYYYYLTPSRRSLGPKFGIAYHSMLGCATKKYMGRMQE